MMKHKRVQKKALTIERILHAAKDVFADKGFAGARVDEIAQRAGLNKAALYYHIGDKKALYAQTIHDVMGMAAERITKGISTAVTPEEKIRTYIKTLAATFDENPQMPRIMMREIASGGQNLPDVFFKDLFTILDTLTGIIEEGKGMGLFIDTMPLLIHFMAIGATVIYKTLAPVMLAAKGLPDGLKGIKEDITGKVAGEIEEIILRAIRSED